jgi:hypothetical protein
MIFTVPLIRIAGLALYHSTGNAGKTTI